MIFHNIQFFRWRFRIIDQKTGSHRWSSLQKPGIAGWCNDRAQS